MMKHCCKFRRCMAGKWMKMDGCSDPVPVLSKFAPMCVMWEDQANFNQTETTACDAHKRSGCEAQVQSDIAAAGMPVT